MDVPANIKQIINEKKLTQNQVAEKAGFSAQQFSDMLNDRKVFRADYLPKIAEALGVEIITLFDAENKIKQETRTRGEMAIELYTVLMDFVKRATKEGATPAEVEALPEVAHVLKSLVFDLV